MKLTWRCIGSRICITLGVLLLLTLHSCENKVQVDKYGSLEGQVLDATTLEPLEGVSIHTTPASTVKLTDDQGNFVFEKVKVEDYTIQAKKVNYKTTSTNVMILENETTTVTITLEEGAGTASNLAIVPNPPTGIDTQQRDLQLQWEVNMEVATPTFDVSLYSANSPIQNVIAKSVGDTFVNITDLKFNTTYFWQVTLYSDGAFIANSEVFSFTTIPFPENRFRYAKIVDGSYEIFSSDSLGDNEIQLTYSASSAEVFPRMNPQRDLIAFSSNKSLEFQIYTMDIEGHHQKQITNIAVTGNHNNGNGFCWSPDGGKFLYSHFDKLYSIDRNGTDRKLITTAPAGRHFRMVDWSAQNGGKIIAQTMGTMIYDSEFYIMDDDGSNMQQLISNIPGRLESPSFSVDGKKVLFTWDEDGLEAQDGRQLDSRIYLMSLDSTDIKDLSVDKQPGTNDLYPRFSPDGSRVIFVNTSNTGIDPPAVFTVSIDALDRRKLFDMATMPDWF